MAIGPDWTGGIIISTARGEIETRDGSHPPAVETLDLDIDRTIAIDAVGLYVPAGTAPLPSAALMLAVPAGIAGCPLRVMCTPPRPEPPPNSAHAATLANALGKVPYSQADGVYCSHRFTAARMDAAHRMGIARRFVEYHLDRKLTSLAVME